jgi:hypothetical protein
LHYGKTHKFASRRETLGFGGIKWASGLSKKAYDDWRTSIFGFMALLCYDVA